MPIYSGSLANGLGTIYWIAPCHRRSYVQCTCIARVLRGGWCGGTEAPGCGGGACVWWPPRRVCLARRLPKVMRGGAGGAKTRWLRSQLVAAGNRARECSQAIIALNLRLQHLLYHFEQVIIPDICLGISGVHFPDKNKEQIHMQLYRFIWHVHCNWFNL